MDAHADFTATTPALISGIFLMGGVPVFAIVNLRTESAKNVRLTGRPLAGKVLILEQVVCAAAHLLPAGNAPH